MNDSPINDSTRLLDRSNNGFNGRFDSSMTGNNLVDGIVGKAIAFDGVNNDVELPAASELLPLNSRAITLSAWIKPVVTTSYIDNIPHRIMSLLHDTLPNSAITVGILHQRNPAFYTFTQEFTMDSAHAWSSSVEDNREYFIALTFENGTFYQYINGVLDGIVTGGQLFSGGVKPAIIGGYNNEAHYFKGIIDEVRISSAARSADWLKLCYET
ncbi:MAG: LamG domain-containing protein, partial [Planctomycetes bacterium]|nr:LamG domain-containing protein [Planctomycetota bacterium]